MTTMSMNSPEFFDFMKQSAGLRRAGKFKEAIALVEDRLSLLSQECVVNALLEAFKAAWELKDEVAARGYAERLYALDPSLPSIRRYLDK